jgi:glycine oxidase
MNASAVDVVVIGDGVIGLSTAFQLGQGGVRCHVIGAVNHGAASGAAAGLLAPSIGKLRPEVQAFFDASLAIYPEFVDRLRQYEPDLVLLEGLLDLSSPASAVVGARFLSADDVSRLEPRLAPQPAVFHPRDGAIDNALLIRALRRAVMASPSCTLDDDNPIVSIQPGAPLRISTRSGNVFEADTVLVAAGAWSSSIGGLPRTLPVVPLKGQMLAVTSTALQHAVMGDDVYLVPRSNGEIAIGATAEHAGFDISVIPESIESLRQSAIRICPALTYAPVTRAWAGLRPATPDMLPILGRDPENPRILYACGHSKNGILLAPATAVSIAALATGTEPALDIGPFSVTRFPAR